VGVMDAKLTEADYSELFAVLDRDWLRTTEIKRRLGRNYPWTLRRLHAAAAAGLMESKTTYGDGHGWRFVWRLTIHALSNPPNRRPVIE